MYNGTPMWGFGFVCTFWAKEEVSDPEKITGFLK